MALTPAGRNAGCCGCGRRWCWYPRCRQRLAMCCWTPPAAPPGRWCKPSRALLAMLADTLLPEAYKVEGMWTGSLVVAGFAISLALSAIE